jgi:HPt (histidine-containing phosphotransfer) domain-containing protein
VQAREILAKFLESARQLAREMRRGLASGNPGAVGFVAHRLKSASRSVGARSMGDICSRIENAGRGGDMQAVHGELPRFEAALELVENDIARILARR